MQNGAAASAHSQTANGQASSIHNVCADLHGRIQTFLATDFADKRLRSVQNQCQLSIQIIREALQRYPLKELSFSYNGGKDCLVLLLLYLSQLHDHANLPEEIPAIYIPPSHPFPVVDEFVVASSQHYHLALARQTPPDHTSSMKEAFASYLQDDSVGQGIKAIFVGTRHTDPFSENLRPFDMTDRGWPSFMRVHPVLEWHYVDIWAFLRWMGAPWCPLYDKGFTSLGGAGDTHPNPKLRFTDPATGQESFKPAWKLTEDHEERLGREKKVSDISVCTN